MKNESIIANKINYKIDATMPLLTEAFILMMNDHQWPILYPILHSHFFDAMTNTK